MSANVGKRIQSTHSVETYAYGTNKDNIKNWINSMCQYNKKIQKMINYNVVIKENIKQLNSRWSEILDHW